MASICVACADPLVVPADIEDTPTGASSSTSDPNTFPDDLTLPCNCHFHWECFFEDAATVAATGQCPSCSHLLFPPATSATAFLSSPPTLIASYHNEGGFDPSVPLGPTLAEEALFSSQPSARFSQALHIFAAEGDISGTLDLLDDISKSVTDPAQVLEVLLWCDPTKGDRTALHAAVEGWNADMAWLMLWLVSGLPVEYFPEFQVKVAQELNLQRMAVSWEEDIRGVRDGKGRTAEDVARELGFAELLQPGSLTPP